MEKRVLIKTASVCLVLLFSIGCATRPEKIKASYVSPLQYQGYSCEQISQELLRVNARIIEVTGQQDKEADKDAAAVGVGMLCFWPALFFTIGTDKEDELSRLMGEDEAIQNMAAQKNCDVSVELAEIKKQREIYEEERKKAVYTEENSNY